MVCWGCECSREDRKCSSISTLYEYCRQDQEHPVYYGAFDNHSQRDKHNIDGEGIEIVDQEKH